MKARIMDVDRGISKKLHVLRDKNILDIAVQ